MNRSRRQPILANDGSAVIPEFEHVRLTRDVKIEGYDIAKDMIGTVVGIYGKGAAYAVEIANLPGGPEVVTLQADQLERVN
jgi:hypothetical protein